MSSWPVDPLWVAFGAGCLGFATIAGAVCWWLAWGAGHEAGQRGAYAMGWDAGFDAGHRKGRVSGLADGHAAGLADARIGVASDPDIAAEIFQRGYRQGIRVPRSEYAG